MKGRGQGMARIGEHKTINPYINNELTVSISQPVKLTGKLPGRVLRHKCGHPQIGMAFTAQRNALCQNKLRLTGYY